MWRCLDVSATCYNEAVTGMVARGDEALGSHPLPPLVRAADRVHAHDDAPILIPLVQHDLTCAGAIIGQLRGA